MLFDFDYVIVKLGYFGACCLNGLLHEKRYIAQEAGIYLVLSSDVNSQLNLLFESLPAQRTAKEG
jgi:hypothetical protein